MKTERNPLGFMGTGESSNEMDGGIANIAIQTPKKCAAEVRRTSRGCTPDVGYTMIELYERRLDDLYETVTKLDPTPCNELILTGDSACALGKSNTAKRFGEPAGPLDRLCSLPSGRKTTSVRRAAADERARSRTVSTPQRAVDPPGDGGGKARVRARGKQPAAVRPRGSRPVRGTAQREGLK